MAAYSNKRIVPKKVGISIVQSALASPTLVGPPNVGDALDKEEDEEEGAIVGNWTLVVSSRTLLVVATFVGAAWEVPVRWISGVGSLNLRWEIIAYFQNIRRLLEPVTQCFARYYSHSLVRSKGSLSAVDRRKDGSSFRNRKPPDCYSYVKVVNT